MRSTTSVTPTFLTCLLGIVMLACGGSDEDGDGGTGIMPAPNLTGDAILDVRLLTAPVSIGGSNTPPPDAFPGYTPMAMDLNEGTGGDYVWLYYKIGRADGADGRPLDEIYTVDVTDGEDLKSAEDTRIWVNLNSGTPVTGHEIYLACSRSDWPVVRGIVVANVDDVDTVTMEDAPPGISNRYPVIWVKERISGGMSASPPGPWSTDGQDLNEGTSWLVPPIISDYSYIGYCVDQEVYDWLNP